MLSAIRVSSRSRLTTRLPRMSFLKWLKEPVMCGRQQVDASRGCPRGCLTAFSTRLEAACMSGEFFPVTIVPSVSSRAAPQEMPSLPLPRGLGLARRAAAAAATTLRSAGADPEVLHQQLHALHGLPLLDAHRVLAGVAEVAADDLLHRRLAHHRVVDDAEARPVHAHVRGRPVGGRLARDALHDPPQHGEDLDVAVVVDGRLVGAPRGGRGRWR